MVWAERSSKGLAEAKRVGDVLTQPADRTLSWRDFDDFYGQMYAPLTRLAFGLCGSTAIAEDLAQETLIKAHGRWNELVRYDRADRWARRVVINSAISAHRKRANERQAADRLGRLPIDAGDMPESYERLWSAVRTLPERQKELIALVFIEGWSASEAARIVGCRESTAHVHLHRARQRLAELLGSAEAGEVA